MPRIRVVETYQVINDAGEVYCTFYTRENAEDYLTDLLEGLRQIEEDEKRVNND